MVFCYEKRDNGCACPSNFENIFNFMFLGDLQSFKLIGVSLGFSFRLMRKPKKAEIWEIFTIIIFCEKYDFYVLVYNSPHSDDKIMIDTSFDSAWSCEDMKGSIEKIGRKMKVGCQVEVGLKKIPCTSVQRIILVNTR